jgi:glycosyltransferase involved in cell wall biosynthesis
MKTVCHLITGLQVGGAQHALMRLATHDKAYRHVVISMLDEDAFGPKLRAANIDVHALNMPRGRPTLAGLRQLIGLLRDLRPHAVQTWLYHADIMGSVAALCAGCIPTFWGIRFSTLDGVVTNRVAAILVKLCAFSSRFLPKKVISCSDSGKSSHLDLGYGKNSIEVVYNGYDVAALEKLAEGASSSLDGLGLREGLGLSEGTFLLGVAARWDPQKDHETLFAALAQLKEQGTRNIHTLLFGMGTDTGNNVLMERHRHHGLESQITPLGDRDDAPALMAALDVHVLPSVSGEGFSNSVAESMAVGTPNIVTDVGDSAMIVGDTGWSVPRQDPTALAQAIAEAQTEWQVGAPFAARRQANRQRIAENFSIERMVSGFNKFWDQYGRS